MKNPLKKTKAIASSSFTKTETGTLTRTDTSTKTKQTCVHFRRKKTKGFGILVQETGTPTNIGVPSQPVLNSELKDSYGLRDFKLTTSNNRKLLNEADCLHIETKSGRFEIRKNANGWWGSQNVEHTKVINFMGTIRICPKIIQACLCAGLTPKQWVYFLKYHPKFCVHLENSDFKVQKDVGDGRVQEIVKSILEKYESAQKNLRREIKSEKLALLN